jgi:serine/threonine-protein kinase
VAQARAMTVLSHPNVTTLFDAGEHEGRVYLAFEFLKGSRCAPRWRGARSTSSVPSRRQSRSADAIADAHANGFVHGGLSPESVAMTQRGHAKIPAFELAAHGGFAAAASRLASEVRLLDYLAPEEAAGHAPDDRSDIYSVGAILYEMLTARRPNPQGRAAPSAVEPSRAARARRRGAARGGAQPRFCGRSRPPPSPRSSGASWRSSTRRAAPATSRRSARAVARASAVCCGLRVILLRWSAWPGGSGEDASATR